MVAKIKIIIADDHPIFIDGIKSLLKENAQMVIIGSAENGEQLIEQVAIHQPDIVLTDIQMPVKNGIEATKEICKRFPEIKVIAITMLNESMFIKKMLEAGAYGYVLKTIDKEELINVITKVASGKKYFNEEVTAQLVNNFSDKQTSNSLPDLLTKREKEILILIAQGLTDKEIAEKIYLSPFTIITHRKNILSKLNLRNKVEITRFAMKNNLIR